MSKDRGLIHSPNWVPFLFDIFHHISEPTAIIFKSVENKDKLSPSVVSFSSRGPSPITSDILKVRTLHFHFPISYCLEFLLLLNLQPDLTAPGVDILAAWSEATTVTGLKGDTRVVPYNIISGTSMSCPHASGAAAYVKSFHPTWSPAAIKSALMTTGNLIPDICNCCWP